MTNKAVHLLALFLLVYIGVEVTIGGNVLHIVRMVFFIMIINNQDGLHRS